MATGKKRKKAGSFIIFMAGLVMVSYPLVSTFVEQRYQDDAVATYERAVDAADEEGMLQEKADAEEYNRALYGIKGIVAGNVDSGILSQESYDAILDLSGTGVMGNIEIPKIDLDLPIYHGTSDEVLSSGIGHVKQSSFPIGGEDTRAILTGHRGLPNAKLFTRLDEMEIGDLFFIKVLGETLAYEVSEIEIIKPEEVEKLGIREGKDMVTLLTCHPYGINSHRLLVTGERTKYVDEVYGEIESEPMSSRETVFAVIPFLFVILGMVTLFRKRKKKKEMAE